MEHARITHQYLFLSWVFSGPLGILLKRVTVQHAPDIAAATGVLVVMPRTTDAGALLYNDEIVALVAFDEINGHAHSF